MKKHFKNTLFLLFSSSIVLTLVGCNSNNDNNVSSLTLDSGLLKNTYGVGDSLDLSSTKLNITYFSGRKETISVLDNGVEIKGNDTETKGKHTLSFTYLENTVTYDFNVEQYVVTLDFNGGTYNNLTSTTVNVYAGKVDLSSFNPTKNSEEDDKTYLFSGWFYESTLNNRASYVINKEVLVDRSLTLYAGYDLDYNDQFIYRIDEEANEVELVSINFDSDYFFTHDDIYIPSTIENYPVTKIGDDFLKQKMDFGDGDIYINDWGYILENERIVFANDSHVNYIGNGAFENFQKLKSISFPASLVTIGNYAFSNSGITGDLTFSKHIDKIGSYSFADLNGALDQIYFEDGSEIKVIGEYAFKNNADLVSVSLCEGIEEIKDGAFSGCDSLTEFYLPSTIRYIGSATFKQLTNLVSIEVSDENKYFCSLDGNLYSKNMTKLIKYCYGNKRTVFDVPSSVTYIEDSAFNVFDGYTYLNKVNLNEGITYIGSEAFYNCYFEITLPSTLKGFAKDAFKNYKGETLNIDSKNTRFKSIDGILYSFNEETLYAIPGNYTKDTYVLPNNVMYIESYAFNEVNTIKYIVINEDSSLKHIYENGMLLNTMKNLKAIEVNTSKIFSLGNNSLINKESTSNNSFICVFKYQNVMDVFAEEFKDFRNDYNLLLKDDVLNNYDTINNSLRYFTKYSLYLHGVGCRFSRKNNLIDGIFFNMLNSIDYCYKFNTLDTSRISYFTQFENGLIDEYTRRIDNNDSVFNATFFDFLYQRIDDMPSSYKDSVKNKYDELTSNLNISNATETNLAALYNEILEFDFDKDNFDVDKYLTLKAKMDTYSFDSRSNPSRVNEKVYQLEICYDIYTLLNTDITSENILKIYDIVNGGADNYFYSLNSRIDNYFPTNSSKNKLYKYEEYLSFMNDVYPNKMSSLINVYKTKIIEFDLSTYDETSYREIFENECKQMLNKFYSYIDDYSIYDKIYAIEVNINVNTFISVAQNGIEKDSISVLLDLKNQIEMSYDFVGENNINNYDTYLSCLETFETYLESYVALLIEDIGNFNIDENDLSTKFIDIKDRYDALSYYAGYYIPNEYDEDSGEEHFYYTKYIEMEISYLTYRLFNECATLSYSNYATAFRIIYGEVLLDGTTNQGIMDYIEDEALEDYSGVYRYDDFSNYYDTFVNFE